MNLAVLSLQDLRNLQDQVSQEIKQRGEQEIAKAREQILSIAQSVGLPLAELVAKTRVKTGPVAARYRNPANHDQQWSGRGRQPQWVKELVASGKSLDTVKI